MKTYEERLLEIAEEMAKVMTSDTAWVCSDEEYKRDAIEQMKPLAAIALKHMAEAYKQAINEGNEYQQYGITQHLIKIGLIEPQTEMI